MAVQKLPSPAGLPSRPIDLLTRTFLRRDLSEWLTPGSIGTLGILIQNATYTIIVPLYLVIYLSTSPLVTSKYLGDYLVDVADTAAIPTSMGLGYVLPAVLMSLPASSIISSEQKQAYMAMWQMFPLWVAILHAFTSLLMAAYIKNRTSSNVLSHKDELNAMRQLYLVLLVFAGIGQISTLTLLATSKLFPTLFAPEFVDVFNLSDVFVPSAISPSSKAPSIGAGAHLLLQYDEYIGSTSMVLFTTVLYLSAYQTSRSYSNIALLAMRGIAILILTGPLGYAVACTWARDELVAFGECKDNKKTT